MQLDMNIGLLGFLSLALAGTGLAQTTHFHPKGRPPSKHTIEVLEEARKMLPFADERDFKEEKKGFIAAPESWTIEATDGQVVWDLERYKSGPSRARR